MRIAEVFGDLVDRHWPAQLIKELEDLQHTCRGLDDVG
jgi:hypothetical protein